MRPVVTRYADVGIYVLLVFSQLPSLIMGAYRTEVDLALLSEGGVYSAIYNPLTGYEPKLLDDFESRDIDTEPSYSCDAELDDEIIGKALSSPLFTQEREDPANRRQSLSLS